MDYHTQAITGNWVEGGPGIPVPESAYPPDAVDLGGWDDTPTPLTPGKWPPLPEIEPTPPPNPNEGPVIDPGRAIAKEAERHIGKPYRHATAGPDSFDCSGFTHYVVKKVTGKVLPRSSYEYNRLPLSLARPIHTPNGRRPGDILLFDSEGNKTVGHVGIVALDGQTMINALNPSQGVVRSDPKSDYFSRIYMGAVRVV